MQVTRMDLDGRGSGSPEGLVSLILKAQSLTIPVDIEELAYALDIEEIAELTTDGFEGGLLTDQYRNKGIILVNRMAGPGRRRFTVGHELAHFLLPQHKPVKSDSFLCSRENMAIWTSAERTAYERMEAEANRFSALILMPPPLLRPYMARLGDPDLSGVLHIHTDFVVSKDAAARAYAQYHDQPVAIVVVRGGVVQRFYKNARFPQLCVSPGAPVPKASHYFQAPSKQPSMTEMKLASAEHWLESSWGRRLPSLFEQVLLQQHGFGLILLWTEIEDDSEEEDVEAELTSAQRLANRKRQWHDR
jgi:Zn-dependent peptidase ImmA (M78 family)